MAPSKKTMLFVCLLFAAVAVVVPGAQGTVIGPIAADIQVLGTLYCSANLSINATGGAILSPPLANATVQIRCEPGNVTIASAQTNASGLFIILNISNVPRILSGGCRAVVDTPILGCNATLPTGNLTAPLSLLLNTTSSLIFTTLRFA